MKMLYVWLIMKYSLSLSPKNPTKNKSFHCLLNTPPPPKKSHFHLLIKHVFFSPPL